MSEKIKNGLRAGIEYIKTYGCGCDHDVGFVCAECCLGRAVSDGLKEIQSLEQEVARLMEENQNLLNFRILDNERLSKKIFSLKDENKRLMEENSLLQS